MADNVNFALLHGGGQGSWVWDETIAEIEAQSGGAARCFALDVPGCGTKRGRDNSGIGMADIAEELVSDIEAAGMRDVCLVGHSQAGTVLPLLFGLRPALFSRLIYVSCTAPVAGQTVLGATDRIFADDPEGAVARAFADPDVPMLEQFRLAFCNDMNGVETDAFLAKLGQDNWPPAAYVETDWRYDHLGPAATTYVECLKDAILVPSWQRIFAARFQADRIVPIGSGHQAMNTKPDELAAILLAEAAA